MNTLIGPTTLVYLWTTVRKKVKIVAEDPPKQREKVKPPPSSTAKASVGVVVINLNVGSVVQDVDSTASVIHCTAADHHSSSHTHTHTNTRAVQELYKRSQFPVDVALHLTHYCCCCCRVCLSSRGIKPMGGGKKGHRGTPTHPQCALWRRNDERLEEEKDSIAPESTVMKLCA